MSVVRIGATKQYSDNWDNIFSGVKGSSSKKKTAAKPARPSAKKKSAKKKSPKKPAKKARRK